jgi:hypothetical protein
MPTRDISRNALERHGIYYDEKVSEEPGFFPDHVDAVRDALLSFDGSIPDEWQDCFFGEFDEFGDASVGPAWTHQPPDAAFIRIQNYERRLERTEEYKIAVKTLEGLHKIAKSARQLEDEPEPEWSSFWTRHVFRQFNDTAEHYPGFK